MAENSDIILNVKEICKEYPGFRLDRVSFTVPRGVITGLIGRNGAGKTTTLKSILGLVHPDSGSVLYFGKQFCENEFEIKQRIGYAAGAVDYYKKKKIRTLASICSGFYKSWDGKAWAGYTEKFMLDENKTPGELSEGMKVKLNLALALSHKAELLILDEPTSGLDPVSRNELLEVFLDLRDRGTAILFSTHITSDLEKCADMITYIKKGRIAASETAADFTGKYLIASGSDELNDKQKSLVHGTSRSVRGHSYLIEKASADEFGGFTLSEPALEEIMVHSEKEETA